jgi:hypothetical protein
MKNVPVAAAVESTNSLQKVKRTITQGRQPTNITQPRQPTNNNQQPIDTTDKREVEKVDYEKDDGVKTINTNCTTTTQLSNITGSRYQVIL